MEKNVSWYYVIIFVVLNIVFSNPILAQETRKPLGAWFGEYELLTFNDEIVWPLDLYADTHYAIPVYYQSVPGLLDRHSAHPEQLPLHRIGVGGGVSMRHT